MVSPIKLDQKIDLFLAEAREQRLGAWTAAPPLVRLLWLFQIDAAPPLFWRFSTAALTSGLVFGAIIFFGNAVAFESRHGWRREALAAAFSGAIFGLFMASYLRAKARQLRFSPWYC